MSTKKIVDVSIIVSNYNNGKYLSSFLSSVMESSVIPAEVILVDDGSQDNSLHVLEEFKAISWLKIIAFEKNQGLSAALNAALKRSIGKYVMRADPDDKLAPDRIQKQFDFMETNPGVDVLGCNVIYFDDESGKKINTSNFPVEHQKIVKTFLRGEHGLQHPTAFVKGDVYRRYEYQKIFPGEDYEVFARMVRDGYQFANLKSPHYFMRVHSGSATSNLKYEHIKVTFAFRDKIFNTRTSSRKVWLYYFHMLNYRRFQQSANPIAKYAHLCLAGLLYPSKVFIRIFRI